VAATCGCIIAATPVTPGLNSMVHSGLNMKKTDDNSENNIEITPAGKVGSRLLDKRKAKGWTREAMADSTGIGAGSIETMETGRRMPGGEQVLILSQLFNVSPNWILTGSDEFLPAPDTGPGDQPTELAKIYVALQLLDPSRRRMLTQVVVDLARAEVPADELPVFEKIMAAGSLVPAKVMDSIETVLDDVLDDDQVKQEFEDQLGLDIK